MGVLDGTVLSGRLGDLSGGDSTTSTSDRATVQ